MKGFVQYDPTPTDDRRAALGAVAIAAGVGMAAFYVLRLYLAREPLPPGPPDVERENAHGEF